MTSTLHALPAHETDPSWIIVVAFNKTAVPDAVIALADVMSSLSLEATSTVPVLTSPASVVFPSTSILTEQDIHFSRDADPTFNVEVALALAQLPMAVLPDCILLPARWISLVAVMSPEIAATCAWSGTFAPSMKLFELNVK
jgi:hypothetical protein